MSCRLRSRSDSIASPSRRLPTSLGMPALATPRFASRGSWLGCDSGWKTMARIRSRGGAIRPLRTGGDERASPAVGRGAHARELTRRWDGGRGDGTAMKRSIRVAVADDHPVVREGLVAMLETQRDFAVVGEVSTGPEAVALVSKADPDVLLLDLELPGLDGVGVLR